MKKIVGRRKNYNPDMREALLLVSAFVPGAFHAPNIRFDETCSKCKSPLVIMLREDIKTGEVWLEGPDKCSECGNKLSNPNSTFQLSQEAIAGYFGKC